MKVMALKNEGKGEEEGRKEEEKEGRERVEKEGEGEGRKKRGKEEGRKRRGGGEGREKSGKYLSDSTTQGLSPSVYRVRIISGQRPIYYLLSVS